MAENCRECGVAEATKKYGLCEKCYYSPEVHKKHRQAASTPPGHGGDTGRYNQLPVIADRMGLSTASDRTLWKDRAMTELNLAVLHSFSAAGVTISDHHTESVRFLQHIEREERCGRACPADWTWIVPPAASSATAVFHRYYQNFDQTPNYYRHPPVSQVGIGPPPYRLPQPDCVTPSRAAVSAADTPSDRGKLPRQTSVR